MIVDKNGDHWYWDTKEEMLQSVSLFNFGVDQDSWSYYELTGTVHKLSTALKSNEGCS